jgi:hypothetical protein
LGIFPALVLLGSAILPVGIDASEAPPAAREKGDAADPRPASLAGSWILDPERSDPPTRMVEALEIPWYARALVRAATPKFEMRPVEAGVLVERSGPGGDRRQRIWADGVERSGEDQLERTYRERSRWEGTARLVVDRWVDVPSGVVVHIRSSWERRGGTLVNRATVRVGDDAPFDVRRIFVPNEV